MVIERPYVLVIARVARMSISNRSLPGPQGLRPHAQGDSAVVVVVVLDDNEVPLTGAIYIQRNLLIPTTYKKNEKEQQKTRGDRCERTGQQ